MKVTKKQGNINVRKEINSVRADGRAVTVAEDISFAQVEKHLSAIPRAEAIDVFDKSGEKLKSFKGIRNMKTKEVKQIFGEKYWLVNHDEVLGTVADACIDLGLKGKAKIQVSPDGDRMCAYFLFDGKLIPDNTRLDFDPKNNNKGIQYGIMVQNSFDASCPIRVTAYGMRLVCSNGMAVAKAFTQAARMHIINEKAGLNPSIRAEVHEMVKAAIDGEKDFRQIVEVAMKESYSWEVIQSMIAQMLEKDVAFKHLEKIFGDVGVTIMRVKDEKTKKWRTSIIKEKNFNGSRWALYNAFTSHLTHNETVGYALREHLSKVSERVLLGEITVKH